MKVEAETVAHRGLPAPFPEWREVAPASPLRQGDVLTSLQDEPDRWRKLLVVITADCDLAKQKHAGSLTCVPILEVEDYLLRFKYAAPRGKLLDQLVAQILRTYAKAVPDGRFREISEDRLLEWIMETTEGTLTDALGIEGDSAASVEALAQAARSLLTEEPSSVQHAASLLGGCKMTLGQGTDLEKHCAQFANNIAGTVNNLPGDALFLNELSVTHKAGYVAYLRRVVEIDEQQTTTTLAHAAAGTTHIRISQLRSPYVHALSQQFGAVFSAIGLPTEYEVARTDVVKRIIEGDVAE